MNCEGCGAARKVDRMDCPYCGKYLPAIEALAMRRGLVVNAMSCNVQLTPLDDPKRYVEPQKVYR